MAGRIWYAGRHYARVVGIYTHMAKTEQGLRLEKVKVANAIFISDLHCGCQFGLCPEKIELDGGGIYHPSRFQREILDCWNSFWKEWVPRVTRKQPFVLVILGDTMDHRHHGATTQITQNIADQQNIAYEMLAPIVDKSVYTYYIRGSVAHTGPSGEAEEQLARRLGTKQDETNNYSRYELYLKIGSCLIHATHHIGVTGSLAYETTALMKEFAETTAESARWGKPVPNVVARGHRHRHAEIRVPTAHIYGYCFTVPGWQLKTPYVFRGMGRISTPQLGGSLVRQGDEEFFTRHRVWSIKRPRTETPSVEVT